MEGESTFNSEIEIEFSLLSHEIQLRLTMLTHTMTDTTDQP